MKTRDVIILAVVLLGIVWLLVDNYQRGQKAIEKPATIERSQPVQK